jgi:hypothetical protein
MSGRLTWILSLSLAVACLAGIDRHWKLAAQDSTVTPPKDDETKRQDFMRAKLAMVHKIVDGLATEDFELIEEGATELVKISDSAAWQVPNDVYYRYYSANFEHAARALVKVAQAKSIEKATFSYVHVTISCTACHQHVRNAFQVANHDSSSTRR